MEFEFNKLQSKVNKTDFEQKPKEVQEQFIDFINNIPFIKSLIAKNRPYAEDLERDADGKIIIDITKPHILKDMDYFRPSALHYKEHGCYTHLRPNTNPNSEFGKWIREEIKRCYYGYVRESDGEWITGDYYFFLNYCPIQVAKTKEGSKKAERVIDFPDVWEGHYYMFHYLEQARNNGHHAFMLARRGCGKSYTGASRIAKRFVLGESTEVNKKVQCVVTASERKYLQGANQILDMFVYYIDFLANNTQFPSQRLVNSLHDLQWTMGYLDAENGTKKGTLNSVIGITSKDDESKLRGSRGQLYTLEEIGCHLKGTEVRMYNGTVKKVEDIVVHDLLMGDDGTPREVLDLYSGTDKMYKITLSNGDYQIVNSNHPIIYKTFDWSTHTYTTHLDNAPTLMKKNISKGYYISKSNNVNYPYQSVIIDPYLLGLWLGDGDATRIAISNEDQEVLEWLETYCNNNKYSYSKRFLPQSKRCYNVTISAKNKILWDEFNRLNLKGNKHIPDCYKYNSKEVVAAVIAGFIDTDGYYNVKKHYYELTQLYKHKEIIYDIKEMCEYLGLRCTLKTRIASKSSKGAGHLHYRLLIRGDYKLPIKIKRKQATERSGYKNKRNWLDYSFKIEEYGNGEYYGFTVDKNNLFLLKDYTIVHNTFPRLLNLYAVLRPSVEDGDSVFGQIVAYGTAGDNESDFSGAQELMYNPIGYNIQEVPNVYDIEGKGRKEFTYFFPAYLNRSRCYDKDGNSDVIKALLEILKDRYITKYNSTDINAITKRISELPITPAEAILRATKNIFPITELTERLTEIDNNPSFYNEYYIGELVIKKDGTVEFKPTIDIPIRDFPLKDNKAAGAIEIFEMPIVNSKNKVPQDRYIIGHDPKQSMGLIVVIL